MTNSPTLSDKDPASRFEKKFASVATAQDLVSERLWQSGDDRIYLWTRSSASASAPCIFLSAGIHGDEPCGPEALLRFLEQHPLSTACDWVIAPLLNPSGLNSGTRENRNGVDLNRDFYRKKSGEIRALTSWWESRNSSCDLHFSLHEDWETSGLYLYEINTGSIASFAEKVLDSIRGIVVLENKGPVDGHELSAPGLIRHAPEPDEEFGWPEAIWLAKRHPLFSLTIEGPGCIAPACRTVSLLTALTSAVIEAETIAEEPSRLHWPR